MMKMRALLLNSGIGSRMGELTREQPKCMTHLLGQESILSRQLWQLAGAGVSEAVVTTGYCEDVLKAYCERLAVPIKLHFVKNPLYKETNYIYSIYLARGLLGASGADGLLLLHGDLVFSDAVLDMALSYGGSCMAVSSSQPLPEKDFKAVIRDGRILKVGVEFFAGADPAETVLAAQPLYKLLKEDWAVWLSAIIAFCESGDMEKRRCYAENALNTCSENLNLYPLDFGTRLCQEVDAAEDLRAVQRKLLEASRG